MERSVSGDHSEVTVSLCMIVKDEEAVLERCLENALRFADGCLIRDRLVKRELVPEWIYPVHEAIPVQDDWHGLFRPDIRIFHRKVKKNARRRNINILEKEIMEVDELSSFQLAYYVRELAYEGEYENSAGAFDKLWNTGTREDIGYALYYYIGSMLRLGRDEELRGRLESYVGLYGENEAALCILGDLYRKRKDFERAIEFYENASRIKPDLTDYLMHFPAFIDFLPHMGCCKAYIEMRQFDEAERELAKAEAVHPSNGPLLLLKLTIDIGKRKAYGSKSDDRSDDNGH